MKIKMVDMYLKLTNCPAAIPAANRDDAINSFMTFLDICRCIYILWNDDRGRWYSCVCLIYDDGDEPVIDVWINL